MSFAALVSILETKELYCNCILEFDDPYEAHIPDENIKAYFGHLLEGISLKQTDIDGADKPALSRRIFAQSFKRNTFMSCWHMSTYESEAMWQSYAKLVDGVAVKSTVARVSAALPEPYRSVPVEYIDYKQDSSKIIPWNMHLFKRRSFEHEKELRFTFIDANKALDDWQEHVRAGIDKIPINFFDIRPAGRREAVNLSTLVTDIYVNPMAPDWFLTAVRLVVKRHAPEVPVERSPLREIPKP